MMNWAPITQLAEQSRRANQIVSSLAGLDTEACRKLVGAIGVAGVAVHALAPQTDWQAMLAKMDPLHRGAAVGIALMPGLETARRLLASMGTDPEVVRVVLTSSAPLVVGPG
jgi:hypothetical protein